MYFPKGFDQELSIELGKLVGQAYDQFEAFESEKKWELKGKYSLIKELYYLWTPTKALEKGIHSFDATMDRIRPSNRGKDIQVPIGFLAKRDRRVFVIFRGTLTIKEWIRNFSIGLNPYLLPNYGKVHEGFLQTYRSIRKEVIDSLLEQDQGVNVFVAGHSLGAAIATLSLPDIEANTKVKVTSTYTFGSPRVGDDTFTTTFNSKFGNRSFRIVNTSDIVTSIPFPGPIMGKIGGYFSHVDTPVDLTVQMDDLEKNHSMKTYIQKLTEGKGQKGLLEKLFVKSV